MALTKSFKDTIQKRVQEDSEFRVCLLTEAIDCFLQGDTETGKTILRDYINATIGFEELAHLTQKSSKSLMRMLSSNGNPYANNLFEIIYYLQLKEGLKLKVSKL
ncbi:transcriptional regulator [Geminocystis sp. GBBB08]|uniref:helix-turn-helix domain-containing transcriptional regulator n=1 Tax=Geminocystis sp. GBBB08 TaxID=2604140 RepID=UPI0027E300AC|nr:transcriptional regulator [Geminocystis sp. GBBB08]MBL1209103.1 transcriptional regulator [Geminocystis sp. GBBB08]